MEPDNNWRVCSLGWQPQFRLPVKRKRWRQQGFTSPLLHHPSKTASYQTPIRGCFRHCLRCPRQPRLITMTTHHVRIYIFTSYFQVSHLHKYSYPLISTLLKHLWQRLQPRVFLDMTLQAWHTCIWGVSPILLCRSSQAMSG